MISAYHVFKLEQFVLIDPLFPKLLDLFLGYQTSSGVGLEYGIHEENSNSFRIWKK